MSVLTNEEFKRLLASYEEMLLDLYDTYIGELREFEDFIPREINIMPTEQRQEALNLILNSQIIKILDKFLEPEEPFTGNTKTSDLIKKAILQKLTEDQSKQEEQVDKELTELEKAKITEEIQDLADELKRIIDSAWLDFDAMKNKIADIVKKLPEEHPIGKRLYKKTGVKDIIWELELPEVEDLKQDYFKLLENGEFGEYPYYEKPKED